MIFLNAHITLIPIICLKNTIFLLFFRTINLFNSVLYSDK